MTNAPGPIAAVFLPYDTFGTKSNVVNGATVDSIDTELEINFKATGEILEQIWNNLEIKSILHSLNFQTCQCRNKVPPA